MKKKLILGLAAIAAILVTLPMFAAFEAHVINVTAQIENALYVHPQSRTFGTVFPQEYLAQGVFVNFSESFSEDTQTRVGTVEYVIKQKPKPLPAYAASVGVDVARAWCHDNYPVTPYASADPAWTAYLANCYPSLCPYLSKHPEVDENPLLPGNQTNDGPAVLSFHDPFDPSSIATGKINKFGIDVGDVWVIDLAVPCFEGQCAQDWASFVQQHNPAVTDPDAYQLPQDFEHDVFGCDLWFEVTDIY